MDIRLLPKMYFRVRRMVGNQLKVEKMELSHKVPLKYDFLRISDMLPEAMDWGENACQGKWKTSG